MFFFFKQKTAYEMRISDGVQTCALPISGWGWVLPSPTGNPSPPNPPLEGEGLTRLRNESMNAQEFDILIIGGGHNGLVCAAYLAAAGLKVRVLERRNVVGGAAVTEELFPGVRNSVASSTVSLLNPQVIADLILADDGLGGLVRAH